MNEITGFRQGRWARLLAFVVEAHPPAVYVPLSLLWSLSVVSMLSRFAEGATFRSSDLVVSAVFFLVLLFLRAVDEIKDLDYDRIHNPGRPLVRGAVSALDVWLTAALAGALAIALAGMLAPVLALFVGLNLAYGLGLLGLERRSVAFRDNIILNLLVTFPVSAALNLFASAYLVVHGAVPGAPWVVLVVLAHVLAFLHLEFGRKLRWPEHEMPGGNGYAQELGITGALATCTILGVGACAVASLLHWQSGAGGLPALLPWLSLLATGQGVRRFFRSRERPVELKPYFGVFLMSFFALNLLVATVARAGVAG